MNLREPEVRKANLLHKFLKNQPEKYFKEHNIRKCEKCQGFGLNNIYCWDGSYSWDGTSYCDECKGVGFLGVKFGLQIDLLHYFCRSCFGTGCSECNEKGIVDWIAHSMGR